MTEMLQEEPDVTREERTAIVEYLSTNFSPGGKIYINHAEGDSPGISPSDLVSDGRSHRAVAREEWALQEP